MGDENENVDAENLTVTGAHEGMRHSNVDVLGDSMIVVTQAFDAAGNNLVGVSDVTFDGHPAVSIKVRADGKEGVVHLSPIHGDNRKQGFTDIAVGAKCELFSPVTNEPLEQVGETEDGSGAGYYALYLNDKRDRGAMIMVSDIWGHYHSRIVDDMELISYWAATHEEL